VEKAAEKETHLMGIQQAAEYLGLSVGTMYQWRSQRRIPYIKVGWRVKFKKEQLDQWLAERTVQVGLEPGLKE